jgi:hypothetical protein
MWQRDSLFLTGLVALLLVAGCKTLLPAASMQTEDSWDNYDAAQQTLDLIQPFKTKRVEVHKAGIDPFGNASVVVLNYADVMQRFPALTAVKQEDLDRGLAECLRNGKRCTGYAISIKREQRKRVGSFWLDSLNFRRETEVYGWNFQALIVFVDDLVVYTLTGGQPNKRDHESTRNPLGPLQGWGESMRPSLR